MTRAQLHTRHMEGNEQPIENQFERWRRAGNIRTTGGSRVAGAKAEGSKGEGFGSETNTTLIMIITSIILRSRHWGVSAQVAANTVMSRDLLSNSFRLQTYFTHCNHLHWLAVYLARVHVRGHESSVHWLLSKSVNPLQITVVIKKLLRTVI